MIERRFYMKTCPITEKPFEPASPEHFFASFEAFETFIDELDPMDQLVETKRVINWSYVKKNCSDCGNEFMSNHPASIYCESCKEAHDQSQHHDPDENRVNPNDFYEPKVKECDNCHRSFLATKPAMKYCEKCSERGGKIINN